MTSTPTPQELAKQLRKLADQAERLPYGAPRDDTTAQWIIRDADATIHALSHMFNHYTAHLNTNASDMLADFSDTHPLLDIRFDDALTTAWKSCPEHVGNCIGAAVTAAMLWAFDQSQATTGTTATQ